MLDSLGSTLSRETINSFFTRFGKKPAEVLTVNEAIQCLETELSRPASEKKRINVDESSVDTSLPATPSILGGTENQLTLNLDKLDFSGPPGNVPAPDAEPLHKPSQPTPQATEPMQQPLVDATVSTSRYLTSSDPQQSVSTASSDAEESTGSGTSSPPSDVTFERVINVKSCPLCHRSRMNSKAEVDIVTHMAICASQDWARVDRIVVGNFVTASQAQRKWYTKVIHKVSAGDYRLGAVSIFGQ